MRTSRTSTTLIRTDDLSPERVTERYTFYIAFISEEKFRIVTVGKSLGSMPINQPLPEGSYPPVTWLNNLVGTYT